MSEPKLRCPNCGNDRFTQEVEFSGRDDLAVKIEPGPSGKLRALLNAWDGEPDCDVLDPDVVDCTRCGAEIDLDKLEARVELECRSCGFGGFDADEHDDGACWFPDVHPVDPVFARAS